MRILDGKPEEFQGERRQARNNLQLDGSITTFPTRRLSIYTPAKKTRPSLASRVREAGVL